MGHEAFSWKRLSADQRVITGQVDFAGLIVTADGVGTADVTIYDGVDVGGRQFGTFRTPVSRTEGHGPPVPAHFDAGLFVDIGSNVEEAIVLYRLEPDGLCHVCRTLHVILSPPEPPAGA